MNKEKKRHFKRYRGRSECDVKLDSEVFKGRIIDYSDGIGVVFEDPTQLIPGKQVYINVFDPDIEIKAEVVWVKKLDNEYRAGFSRLDSLQGSLSNFALADILLGLQGGLKTGILNIESGSIIKEVFIKNGDMVYALSNIKEDNLEDMLLRDDKISSEEYKQAKSLLKKSEGKIGKILVALGFLTPKEVFHAVRNQVEEIMLSLFAIEDGNFKFLECALPGEELITLRFSAANIIYRGIRRLENIRHIEQTIPSMEAVLDISSSPINLFQDVDLDESDRKILSNINGKNSLKTVLLLSPSDESDTLRSIYVLLSIGMITAKKKDEVLAGLYVEEIINAPAKDITVEYIDKVEELFSKCETLGCYEILNIEDYSSPEEIRMAYYRATKEFHPDRHFLVSSDDLKRKLTRIFLYITKAYEIISDPQKRVEYDRKLSIDSKETGKIAAPPAYVTESEEGVSKVEIQEKDDETKTANEYISDIKAKAAKEKAAAKETEGEDLQQDTAGETLDEAISHPQKKKPSYISFVIAAAVLITVLFFFFRDSDREDISSTQTAKVLSGETDEENNELAMQGIFEDSSERVNEEPSADTKQMAIEEDMIKEKEPVAGIKTADTAEKPVKEEVLEKSPADTDKEVYPKDIKRIEKRLIREEKKDLALVKPVKQKVKPRRKKKLARRLLKNNFISYEEQFDNNYGNWESYNMTMASARIESGQYYIKNKSMSGTHIILHNADFPHDAEFIIEASIRTVSSSDNNHLYGFVLGASDAGNNYVFQISENEIYSIKRFRSGDPQELAGGWMNSVAVQKYSFNTFKVEKKGKNIRFFINDDYIDEISNILFFGNKIGFIVEGKAEIAVAYTRSYVSK